MEVVKWDGTHEAFDIHKLERSISRLGAPPEIANAIAEQIEVEAHSGMTTQKIYDLAKAKLKEYEPAMHFREDLRTGLARFKGGYDFEKYVRLIFRAHGLDVQDNKVIQGRCVTHEIDGVLEDGDDVIYLEVKHHSSVHKLTPFDVTLAAKAKWDDIQAGYELGTNNFHFTKVLVVSNTKLSSHARSYADCIGLDHLGWNVPEGRGIDVLIEEKSLYPITILKGIQRRERDVLLEREIMTLSQLEASDVRIDAISDSRLSELQEKAGKILRIGQQVNDSIR